MTDLTPCSTCRYVTVTQACSHPACTTQVPNYYTGLNEAQYLPITTARGTGPCGYAAALWAAVPDTRTSIRVV